MAVAPEQQPDRARAPGKAAPWALGLRGSRLLLVKQLLQVCAGICRGSCVNQRCSLPSLEFPCIDVYSEESELAIEITQLGIRKPVCLHLGHTSAKTSKTA